ncbi:phosphoribosylformylglycinamidine synthase subunit PurL [Legionella sp.]|uniref:phosphoribosylformylglycinamidine synthase subunit PurL n=1 Tax=Legionella sp. TaxID=459 RepID=UPI003C8B5AAF
MRFESHELDFIKLTREEIHTLLQQHSLTLTIDEALTLQCCILKRPPTLAECVLWSIQGSEHCSYKSTKQILKTLTTESPNVILGAKEDAGIVSVAVDNQGKHYGIVISHESHNHPSQVLPFEGAATSIGGNVRDVCCMGAEVIAIANGLRFGEISRSKTHWIHEGVVAGIGSYGNAIGVPNIAGDLYYDAAYNDNCLVTVVTLGIVQKDDVIHSYAPKNAKNHVFILVGKATDNSGFGGASFASTSFHDENLSQNKGAIQEPNAFLKCHLLKANYALFAKLKKLNGINQVAFKDLGAGGIACATVELAHAGGYGAEIDLDYVPISMQDLPSYIVLCSETQERFMWLVPPEWVEMVLSHYNEEFALPDISFGAGATVIGKIRTDGHYVVHSEGQCIVDACAEDITKGIVKDWPSIPVDFQGREPELEVDNYQDILLQLLAHENIASRAPLFETYDKQVQGRTHIEAGEADAGVLQPFNEAKYPEEIRQTGIMLSLDQNPRYNKISAYWGAVNAVVESARNVASTGALPQAITDCLCFGNPEKPEQMWHIREAVRGIVDACTAIGLKEFPNAPLPVIAGNVSLYNESVNGTIPPSPMIACLGSIPNVACAITPDLQQVGSLLLLIGERKNECGGSVYYQLHHELGVELPKPELNSIAAEIHAVTDVIRQGLILAAHDISDGGIAVTLAEMCFKNSIGMDVNIPGKLSDDKLLFSESGGFVLEVAKKYLPALDALLTQYHVPFWIIGETISAPRLMMQGLINLSLAEAKQAWECGLREKLC